MLVLCYTVAVAFQIFTSAIRVKFTKSVLLGPYFGCRGVPISQKVGSLYVRVTRQVECNILRPHMERGPERLFRKGTTIIAWQAVIIVAWPSRVNRQLLVVFVNTNVT